MAQENRSAIDAIVEENLNMRDEIDELVEERDAARADAESAEAAVTEEASQDRPTIGYAEESAADSDAEDLPEAGTLESVTAERDSYLADSQRLAADFANYRKQSEKRIAETAATQSAGLVRNLLPVLDACDSAIVQDPESPVGAIRAALLGELERSGLELLAPGNGESFDPEQHEAVMHEAAAADSEQDGPIVAEVLRAGYVWKGKVVRPAMVKVAG